MNLQALPISSIYVAVFIVLQLIFTLRVGLVRRRERISLGHGNNALLEQRIRAHANFTEVVPITLLALVLLEANGTSINLLHMFGVSFSVFRIMHYIAVANATAIAYRFYGMIGTLATMAAAAIALVVSVI